MNIIVKYIWHKLSGIFQAARCGLSIMVSQHDQSKYTWQTSSHIIEAVRCKLQEFVSDGEAYSQTLPYIFLSEMRFINYGESAR